MQIRLSDKKEIGTIQKIHEDAFGPDEGPVVGKLAANLLRDESATSIISLVAEEDGVIEGNVIFSSIRVKGHNHVAAYIMAPVGIIRKGQHKGLGSTMIRHGLKLLKDKGVEFVLVYGDPEYYARFGFRADHHIKAPYKLEYPQGWMAKPLKPGILSQIRSKIVCAKALSDPLYW